MHAHHNQSLAASLCLCTSLGLWPAQVGMPATTSRWRFSTVPPSPCQGSRRAPTRASRWRCHQLLARARWRCHQLPDMVQNQASRWWQARRATTPINVLVSAFGCVLEKRLCHYHYNYLGNTMLDERFGYWAKLNGKMLVPDTRDLPAVRDKLSGYPT